MALWIRVRRSVAFWVGLDFVWDLWIGVSDFLDEYLARFRVFWDGGFGLQDVSGCRLGWSVLLFSLCLCRERVGVYRVRVIV